MRLSPHTAPIRQTRHSSLNGLSVAFIASSCFQLPREGNHLIRSLCSGPITAPSSLIRIGPAQCSASVLSPRGVLRLGFSLGSGATGSRSSAREPVSASRPLYAGRRLPSHQAPGRLVPGDRNAPGFDDGSLDNDASSKGSLSFVSRMLTCSRCSLSFSSNAHHHGSLPQQLGVVWDLLLKADSEGPSPIFHAASRHRFHFTPTRRYMCLCSTLWSKNY